MPARVDEPYLGAWRALLGTHAGIVERVEVALAAASLPPLAWYDVLWALRRAPGRRLRMSELAREVTLSRGGLTKLVDRLERAGVVRRERATEDGRGFYATLTAEGNRTLRRMWPVYADVLHETFVSALSVEEAAALERALRKAQAAAEATIR